MSDSGKVEVRSKIDNILIKLLNVGHEEIKGESFIMSDLGADSLDIVEIGMEIEKEFNIVVPDEVMEHINSVSDLETAILVILAEEPPVPDTD